jgi:hypothetical protein
MKDSDGEEKESSLGGREIRWIECDGLWSVVFKRDVRVERSLMLVAE